MSDELSLGEHRFRSRLVVGTGKYKDFPTMQKAILASGAQMVTVAVRRLDLSARGDKSLLHWIPNECVLLPNTAGCFTAEDAGCAAVMPLGAPIGSGLGLRNPYSLQMILEQAKVPVIVDAGVGTASDCAICM